MQSDHISGLINKQLALRERLARDKAKILESIDTRIRSVSKQTTERTQSKLKIELPIFSGGPSERSMRFLNSFIGYSDAMGATEYNFEVLVEQALRDTATDW